MELEKRAYEDDSTEEDIAALRARVYEFKPGIIMWKEAYIVTSFQLKIYFETLESLVGAEGPFDLMIDLTNAARPTAEARSLLREGFAPYRHRIGHAGVFTGKNFLLNTAAKFVLAGLRLPSFTIHKTQHDALRAIQNVSR